PYRRSARQATDIVPTQTKTGPVQGGRENGNSPSAQCAGRLYAPLLVLPADWRRLTSASCAISLRRGHSDSRLLSSAKEILDAGLSIVRRMSGQFVDCWRRSEVGAKMPCWR